MKLNILVLGAGGNASRNYIKSLRLNKDFIGKIIAQILASMQHMYPMLINVI